MSLPLRIIRSSLPSKARMLFSRPAVTTNLVSKALYSSNITYSGGQATEGQGGFYGSGGARSHPANAHEATPEEQRRQMVAMAQDVAAVEHTMEELERLESLLEREGSGEVSGRSIEIKNSIKKLMTNAEFLEVLNRLEVNGEPVWGLSISERELVEAARNKVNQC